MSEPTPVRTHIRKIMLHEFDRGSNAIQVAKKICPIYCQVISEQP